MEALTDWQKESGGGHGLRGVRSTFISQLCKLLTREGQHRLALDGEGPAQTCFTGALSLFPSLCLQSGLCLGERRGKWRAWLSTKPSPVCELGLPHCI